jgi:hypothetical protein
VLNADAWASTLQGILSGKECSGPSLPDLCKAIGTGSVMHLAGKTFQTIDVGTTVGAGVGTGAGLSGVVPDTVAMTIASTAKGLFKTDGGPKLQDICDAIAQCLVQQLATITLTSAHAPVFVGAGTVVPGSIPVVGEAWGSAIAGACSFNGPQWPNFAKAIGMGCAAGLATATGAVVILGSPAIPVPVPGAGAGTGALS